MTSEGASQSRALTVVIPAYNVAQFVGECLQSVVGHSYLASFVSIIVVIDGATDNTEAIVRAFAEFHKECDVLIIVQENKGLSGARNAALPLVKTRYITFLDADDFWLPKYLDHVFPAIASGTYDLIEYDALLVGEEGRPYQTLKISAGPPNTSVHVQKEDFLRVFKTYSWARVYDINLVRSMPFPEGIRYEDTHTTPWYYYRAKNILSLGTSLIAYRQRRGSILTQPTIDDVAGLNLAARTAAERYEKTADDFWSSIAMRAFQQACARVVVLPFHLWPQAVKVARGGLSDRIAPARGFGRMLQVKATFLYVALLYCKRRTFDKLEEGICRLKFGKRQVTFK